MSPGSEAAALCRRRTGQASALLLAQIVLLGLCVGLAQDGGRALAAALAATWACALAVQVAHYRLTRCGFVARRRQLAPAFINRTETPVRLLLHALVNWSVPALTAVLARASDDPGSARGLAWLVLAGALAVWASFNAQHRLTHRARNLAMSSGFALAVVLPVLPLL